MKPDALIRWSTIVVVILGAIVAGWVSYQHAYWVVSTNGETGLAAKLYPGTIDGLVYSTSMVLLDAARRGLKAHPLAYWLLGAGMAATLAANVWAGWLFGIPGMIIGAWPALALVGSYEMLMFLIRGSAVAKLDETLADTQVIPDTPAPEAPPTPIEAGPQAPKRHRHAAGHPTPEAAELAFAPELLKGMVPDVPLIMKKLHVGKSKAESYREHFMQITQALR